MTEKTSAYQSLLSMPDPVLQPERVLWLHVICQALIDCASRNPEIKQDCAKWVKHDDFVLVCDMAGLDPIIIKDLAKKILRKKNQKTAFALAMKFRFITRSWLEQHFGSVDKDGA